MPSHATILTGRLPADTGIRDNLGFTLNKNIPTVAEELKRAGYDTGAAVSAYVLHKETGISRGFDFYDDDVDVDARSLSRSQRSGATTIRIAEEWISKHTQKPFFFFVHLYEPHTPYAPPQPFPQTYDGEIAYTDSLLGGFFTFLKEQHAYDDAMIVFLSDHGEGLGDHGEEEHGILLYREAIQVPLLVKLPANKRHGEVVSASVQLSDVKAAVLNGAAPVPAAHPIYSETYYPRVYFGWSDLHSLMDGSRHFIRAPSLELYDINKDPAEKKNIANDDRRALNAMREQIAPYIKGPTKPMFDEESAKKLASLGYLGAANTGADEGPLPDPKDRLPTVGNLKAAMQAFQDKRFADADRLMRPLLRDNPRMPYAWHIEAKTLVALGRLPEALDAAKTAFRLSPGATDIALDIAEIALQLGHFDEAKQHAELVSRDMPARADELLARIALARGDVTEALARAKKATTYDNNRAVAFATLGNVQRAMHDYAGSISSFDESLRASKRENQRPVVNVNALRGDSLARLDRIAEAEQAFQQEIALYPANPQPYVFLSMLHASQGDTAGAKLWQEKLREVTHR